MNILIADSDRDFLMAFKSLLELSDNTVHTVFDGTQVIEKLADEQFDAVIVNHNIPRVKCRDIVRVLNEESIPVLVILDKGVHSGMLTDTVLANAYIKLPFMPKELFDMLSDITGKKKHKAVRHYSDIEVNEENFMLCGDVRVTGEEINILETLSTHGKLDSRRAIPYISALNSKLDRLHKKLRIRYLMNEGYRLVTENG